MIDRAIAWYTRRLDWVLGHRLLTIGTAVGLLLVVVLGLGSQLRREFFPEVDAGAFEMSVRGRTGMRIERTEQHIAEVEKVIGERVGKDLELIISEIGVTPDWSAAYTPNAGPMDTIMQRAIDGESQRNRPRSTWISCGVLLPRIRASPSLSSRSTRAA